MEHDNPAGAPGIGPGTVLNGTYRIEHLIGSGGMGNVWLATNIEIEEQEAVKVIKAEWANQPKIAALLRKEAKALRQLAVPEIALFRACATDQQINALYLVTEYVNGYPLTDRINGHPSHPRDVLKLLKRVGTGLKAAHELNIIHRDISPDNILLPGNNLERAKIIDFGIAKDLAPGAETVVGDGFAGRWDYSAPELFSYGRLPVGPWSDIYSLGLVAVALAQGEPVDMGTTMTEANAARQKAVDLDMVPPILHGLLRDMLEPDHERRMQSMGDLLRKIGPIMAKLDGGSASEPELDPIADLAKSPSTPAPVSFKASDAALPPAAPDAETEFAEAPLPLPPPPPEATAEPVAEWQPVPEPEEVEPKMAMPVGRLLAMGGGLVGLVLAVMLLAGYYGGSGPQASVTESVANQASAAIAPADGAILNNSMANALQSVADAASAAEEPDPACARLQSQWDAMLQSGEWTRAPRIRSDIRAVASKCPALDQRARAWKPPLPAPKVVEATAPVTLKIPPALLDAQCSPGPYIVFFDWDRAAVTPEAASVLDNAISAYGNCGNASVRLAGHTDRSRAVAYNMGLAGRRNMAVAAYLASHGIARDRIVTQSFGESAPRVLTPDGVREIQNNRVEITFGP